MYLNMLTCHFYDRSAVVEALFACLGQSKDPLRKPKALFWAHELWCSGEEATLREVLERAYLAHGIPTSPLPSSCLEVLGHILRSPVLPTPYPVPSEVAAARAVALASKSLDPLLAPPAQPTKWSADQRLCLARAVRDAVKHRRTRRLYRLLAGLPHKIALQYLGYPKASLKEGEGFQHVLARLGFAWPNSDAAGSGLALNWPKLPVRTLAARRFALPRALISKEPLEPTGFAVLHGCRVWQEALDKHGIDRILSATMGSLVFRSDDSFEAFYAEFFAEDIPDEWSAAEKAKSHSVL